MDFNYETKQKKTKRSATVWTLLGLIAGAGVLYSLGTFSGIPGLSGDASASPFVHKAVAVVSGDSKVTGTVIFSQTALGHPVTVSGKLKGLDANAKRGFHIHAFGDLTNGCQSPGSHFNPFNADHGAPEDKERHVGDLGNIDADGDGVAEFSFEDKYISLNGPLSIVGRAVMVHTGTDDLGRGGDEDSKKTGNAGGRAACGVIGVTPSE